MTKYVGKAVWNYPLQFWNRPATNLIRARCQKKFEKLDRDQVLLKKSFFGSFYFYCWFTSLSCFARYVFYAFVEFLGFQGSM